MPVPDDDAAVDRLAGLGLAPVRAAEAEPARELRPAARPGPLTAAVTDRLPPWARNLTAEPTGRALIALGAVCLCCILVTAWVWLRRPAVTPSYPPVALPAASAIPIVTTTPTGIVVDVGGRVRHPGLVTLVTGARVADALEAAGGALRPRDLATLNLAAHVTDGQLLLVGVTGAASGSAAGPSAGGADTGPVDLNSATLEQLDALPGIGPVLAQRILDWRTQHGGFHSVSDLDQVSGIGASIFAEISPLVRV